jgi:hypothetical protein
MDQCAAGRYLLDGEGRGDVNIPRRFQIMGHTIDVQVIAPKDWKHKGCVGYFDPANYTIAIKRSRPSQMAHVFFHELTHAVLAVMSHDLYEDETFVDSFGGLLAQALSSAKYDAPIRRKPRKG